MSPHGRTLATIVALAVLAGGCGGGDDDAAPQPRTGSGPPAAVAELDGLYVARLDPAALRRALRSIKPPVVPLHGGLWTLTIDSTTRRLNFSHPEEGDYEQRITALDGSEIELAPDTACEQPGAGRTEPSRLAWFRSGAYLRLKAVDVPCPTNAVLLTLAAWRKR